MAIRNFIKIAACFLAAFSVISCSQTSKEEVLNSNLETIVKNYEAVGLAVAAVKDGKIIYSNTFGYKDLDAKTPLQESDIFRIASISKSFTALGIMQMVEQGKIDLEGDVSKYVGFDVKNPNFPDKVITMRMLLSHTSSINDSEGYYCPNAVKLINPDSNKTYAKAFNNYEPGTSYEYCNLGYNTLGTILERVSGERFDKYIVNHILKPIDVYAGYEVGSLDANKFVQLYAYQENDGTYQHSPEAYMPRTKEIENYIFGVSTPVFSPTGGLKISAKDLAKVMLVHMNYGSTIATEDKEAVKIIDKHSAEIMQSKIAYPTDEGDSYGFAIRTSDQLIDGKTMIGHTGGAYGVITTMFWDKEREFGIVTMTNGCKPGRVKNFPAFNREVNNEIYNTLIKK